MVFKNPCSSSIEHQRQTFQKPTLDQHGRFLEGTSHPKYFWMVLVTLGVNYRQKDLSPMDSSSDMYLAIPLEVTWHQTGILIV